MNKQKLIEWLESQRSDGRNSLQQRHVFLLIMSEIKEGKFNDDSLEQETTLTERNSQYYINGNLAGYDEVIVFLKDKYIREMNVRYEQTKELAKQQVVNYELQQENERLKREMDERETIIKRKLEIKQNAVDEALQQNKSYESVIQEIKEYYDDGVCTYEPHCEPELARLWEKIRSVSHIK